MKRSNWNHVMALTTVFAILGTGRVWAGTNAWTSIGLQGGSIAALSIDPHNPRTLYAATSGGAFKSLDGGANWVKSGMPNKLLVFDPQDPKTIYVFDYGQGISKSTDSGTSWNPANSGLYPWVNALAIDPLKPSTLYAGTVEGIFKSTDGGNNWSPANSGLPIVVNFGPPRPPNMHSLVIDPQDPSTLYAVVNGIFYLSSAGLTVGAPGAFVKSTDGGGSWNIVDLGLPQPLEIPVLAIDPQNPSTLYVGANYGIFKSTDGGVGWSPVNSGLTPFETGPPSLFSIPFSNGSPYFLTVAIDPRQPDTVYAAINPHSFGSRMIYKTTNGGASWSDSGSGLPEGTSVNSLQIDPQIPATLYAGTSVGGFKSTDGGTSWTAANSGLTAIWITDVAIDPRNANTLYAATSSGLVKTTDGGTNWSPPNPNVGRLGLTLAIDPQNTSTIFAPGCTTELSRVFPPFSCGVVKSTDGGTSWSASFIGQDAPYGADSDGTIFTLAIDPRNSNIVYATTSNDCGEFLGSNGAGGKLHKSVDGGMNWSHSLFKRMGVFPGCVLELVVDPQNSGHLYAAFLYGGVFKSTDAGATWNAANSGLIPGNAVAVYNAEALAIDPKSPNTVYTVSSSGVFKSSDGGMSWNPASSGLPDWSGELNDDCLCFRPRLAVDPQNSARVYLLIGIGGATHVFQSSDGGASWTDSFFPVSDAWFTMALAISSQGTSTVYAGTGHEVFAVTFPPEP